MTVRSYELRDGQPVAPERPPRASPMWPLGVVAVILGSALWLISARYTLAGWVMGLNVALSVAQLPLRIPAPTGWWWLLMVPAGLIYSLVELRIAPGPPPTPQHIPIWLVAVSLVIFVHATDIGSTFLGYATPVADPWPLHRWAATGGWWALGLWSVLLTYFPERAILWGMGWIVPRRYGG